MTYQGAKNSTRIISWFPILLSKSSSVNSRTSLAWVHPAKKAKTNNLNISVMENVFTVENAVQMRYRSPLSMRYRQKGNSVRPNVGFDLKEKALVRLR